MKAAEDEEDVSESLLLWKQKKLTITRILWAVLKKMCLQYPNLPKGEFLIQYHKTNKIHMKHKVKLLLTMTTRNLILVCYIPPFIWGSRASNNFILIFINNCLAQPWNESRNCVSRYSETKVHCLGTKCPQQLNVAKLLQVLNLVPKIFSITCRSFDSVQQFIEHFWLHPQEIEKWMHVFHS